MDSWIFPYLVHFSCGETAKSGLIQHTGTVRLKSFLFQSDLTQAYKSRMTKKICKMYQNTFLL